MAVRRSTPVLAVLALVAGAVAGCGAPESSGQPQVVASFDPLQYVAERVAGEHAEVSNLTARGVEPHDLELSPRQAARISSASVVFYQQGLQPAVGEAISNDRPEHVVDAADVVDLHQAEEHREDAGADSGEDSGDDGHGHDGADPHFWLDPTLLAQAAEAFTETMVEADAEHASAFRADNETLQAELEQLDESLQAGLADCRTRTIVVSHDAFSYLGERYDLDVHAIAGLSPGAEPSPRHLAELADLIRTDKITTAFSERLASPKLADTLAADLDITTAVLDPIEGLTSDAADDDYLSLMRENLAAIQKANGCG